MFLAFFEKKIIVGKPNIRFGKINVDMLSGVEATVFLIYSCVIVIVIFLKGLEQLRLTHFTHFTFLYPLKTSENHRFSDVFRGYRNVTLDCNELIAGDIIILTKFLGIWHTMAHVNLLCTKDGIDT